MALSTSLVSPFDFQNPSLLRGRVHLLADALMLTGWHWRGRYKRRIALDRILHADVREGGLILWLFDGETLRLRVQHPEQWKEGIEAALEQSSMKEASLQKTDATNM